jgi:hypothetical protein
MLHSVLNFGMAKLYFSAANSVNTYVAIQQTLAERSITTSTWNDTVFRGATAGGGQGDYVSSFVFVGVGVRSTATGTGTLDTHFLVVDLEQQQQPAEGQPIVLCFSPSLLLFRMSIPKDCIVQHWYYRLFDEIYGALESRNYMSSDYLVG